MQDMALSSHAGCGCCTANECQNLGKGSVDLQLSAECDHDRSIFLFPVAGVWSNRELHVAVAELLTLCPQVQRDQGLAAPLALHWPLPTQQVTAQTCPEVHRDTSQRDTGPSVPSEDSDGNEVNNLAYNQLKVFNYQLPGPKNARAKIV